MSRRFLAFLIVLTLGLQGPSLAYAGAVSAKTMPPVCAGHTLDQHGHNCPCCPQGGAPGLCCTGGVTFTGVPAALSIRLITPGYRMPVTSDFVGFATERPTPLLRPPIS